MIKIGVIKEGKVPSDERVPLTPNQIKSLKQQFGGRLEIQVKSSDVRRISDKEYASQGLSIVDTVDASDFLIGVKEVPIDQLISNKTYFFFSHTIKKQPYNKSLLRAVLDKGITLIDWECLRDAKGRRLIGFGRYAGIVGAYNGFRALGLSNGKFNLKKAQKCTDRTELDQELTKIKLDPIKILLTGRGKVAKGALEILETMNIKKVGVREYLTEQFKEPVYCQISFEHYFKKRDGSAFVVSEFMANPSLFESNFMRFAKVTDYYIAGHFWGAGSPFLFTREDAKLPDFNISLIADISCDIDGPVASTLRPSTIEDPFYGYDPKTESEVAFGTQNSITVMAVDNLPCELPRDASHDFGEMFIASVLPSIMNGDQKGILQRATIAKDGKVTEEFAYLRDWVEA